MGDSKIENVLDLQNVCVSFSGIKVLEQASFSLKKNEVHAIVGKNGAGKSSFMKVVTGVYTPDSGKVSILGKEAKVGRSYKKFTGKVSMVYQDLSLISSLTVTQNIFLGNYPYKKYGILQDSKANKKVREILESIGTGSISPKSLVEDLSVGESQLVEIAKAMASNPEIIIFDEPTASLSNVETLKLFETIKTLKSKGISIIYITHYLEDVMNICDSVTVLREGKTISTNKIKDTSIPKIVVDMLGDVTIKDSVVAKKTSRQKQKKVLELVNAKTKLVGPVSLCAYEGDVIGIAGLLGSGRTEILRLLYGLDLVISGSVEIDNKSVKLTHPKVANEYGITLVPEERRTQGLVLDFSVANNVSMSILEKLRNKFLLSKQKEIEIANYSISSLEIKTTGFKQVVRFLSGGNQQKVVVGKCLASRPRILLLDDPTFGVDIQAKNQIMRIIQNFANEGNVVIFVSSEFGEIARFCTKTYIIKKGETVNCLENNLITEKSLFNEVQ